MKYEVTVERNLCRADTKKKLDHFQQRARLENVSALVVIVLSHGEKVSVTSLILH